MRLRTNLFLLAGLLASVSATVVASQTPAHTIQTLIQKGELEAAQKHLASLEGPEHQMKRFHGLIALQKGDAEIALKYFERVIELKPEWKSTYLYLAQAQLQLKKFPGAIASLQKCQQMGEERPGFHRLLVRAYLGANDYQKAYEAVQKAQEQFPKSRELQLDTLWLSAKAGLIHNALDELERLVAEKSYPTSSIVFFARIACKGIRYPQAQRLLEQLLQTHPVNGPLFFEAGLGYAQLKRHLIAARFFERAHQLGHRAAFEAADQFRLASNHRKALELNAQVSPKKKQLNQRLNIHLSANKYQRAITLEPLFSELDILDDSSRYRLGYAFVQLQEAGRASQMASAIEDHAKKEQLTALVKRVRSSDITTGVR